MQSQKLGGHHMEKIITLLSEIEEKAEKIIENTSVEKEHLHKQFEEDIKLLDEQITNDTNNKLDELRSKINQSIEDEKNKLIEDCNKQLSVLENDFTKHHKTLVDKVFNSIIGA